MLTGTDLRTKYLRFFESKEHKIIPSAPLVPEGDPTTLFTSSGMQPLIPYLLGQKHPLGTRLVNSQRCFRAQDIEEVGDNRHTTFFEMLGNWSLGDYFKNEQLKWVWEFFTKEVGLFKERLHVTLFSGNNQVARDEQSYQIWKDLGLSDDHIHYYDAKKNWWSRSGTPDQMPAGEPGGPDSEVFYDFGAELRLHEISIWKDEQCHVNCDCGRFLEIGNSVFMQYQKQPDGSIKELSQKNVDFGGGLERILAAANNDPDVFKTDLFWPIIEQIEKITNQKYESYKIEMRVITDHLKAATFLISEQIEPSNKLQGYVVRRLLRRAAVKLRQIKGKNATAEEILAIAKAVVDVYPLFFSNPNLEPIRAEIDKFNKTLEKGLKQVESIPVITPQFAFNALATYGIPFDVTRDIALSKGQKVSIEDFEKEMKKHQELSRTASSGMFKGGLADHSETVTKYHTATHLLQQALRDVLGPQVRQAGSNLTSERLRFDFTYNKALSENEISKVEEIINQKITDKLPVKKEMTSYDQAINNGALAFFKEKYPDQVSVYHIGDYSHELCGGPHVNNTGEIGKIRITRQESLGSSVRRVYLQMTA